MSLPYVVTTACCGEDYAENDVAVTYRDGDWWCTWDEDCARWSTWRAGEAHDD